MSATVTSTSNGLVQVQVSGRLSHAEYAATQAQAAAAIQQHGTISMLIVAENFQGWEKNPAWDDISFTLQNDPFIRRIAIVGDAKWRDLALLFTAQGVRKVAIEFFTPEQLARAYAWVSNP